MTPHALLILHTVTIMACMIVGGAVFGSRMMKRIFPRSTTALGVACFFTAAFIAAAINLWFASL